MTNNKTPTKEKIKEINRISWICPKCKIVYPADDWGDKQIKKARSVQYKSDLQQELAFLENQIWGLIQPKVEKNVKERINFIKKELEKLK